MTNHGLGHSKLNNMGGDTDGTQGAPLDKRRVRANNLQMDIDASDKLNDMIDEAIKALVDDDINRGADELTELAQIFAKAGTGMESFLNVRQYIIMEARKQTCAPFIAEKLKLIERRKQHGRTINNLECH